MEKGKSWTVVAKGIENKSDRQCRERFLLIDPELKQGEWTDEEVMVLHDKVAHYYNSHEGVINWEFISRQMKRCSNHCRKRWGRVVNAHYVGLLKDLLREIMTELEVREREDEEQQQRIGC